MFQWSFLFDWKNPTGYLIAFLVQYISVFCIANAATCYTAVISGSCWIFISMAKDIKQNLNAINEIGKFNKDRSVFLDRLSQLIELHSQAKRLSEICQFFFSLQFRCKSLSFSFWFRFVREFSATYQFILLVFLIWSSATICGTLLMIQMEIVECLTLMLPQKYLIKKKIDSFMNIHKNFLVAAHN